MSKPWIAFFSQTGKEILDVSERIGRKPDLIITNNKNYRKFNPEFYDKFSNIIVYLPEKPNIQDYHHLSTSYSKLFTYGIITLHGYLRIIPREFCEEFKKIYNLHPGLITKYPELKGFNPQERAFNGDYETCGCVIHEVIPEVDSGKVIMSYEIPLNKSSLDEVYNDLHILATDMRSFFLKNILNL